MRAAIIFPSQVTYLAALAIDGRRWGNRSPIYSERLRASTLERFCSDHAALAVLYGRIPSRRSHETR